MPRINTSILVLIGVATAFFPRVLTELGAPKLINFIHFAFVIYAFLVIVPTLSSRVSLDMLKGLGLFLLAICLSAIVNSAGAINVLLEFLLLTESLLLLVIITGERWSLKTIRRFRFWIFGFAMINTLFSFYQTFALGLHGDDVKGVFLEQGAGHHINGAVALTAAVYFYNTHVIKTRWILNTLVISCVLVVIFSDAKQVLAAFLASLIVLSLLKVADFGKLVRYALMLGGGAGLLVWASKTIFPALNHWAKIDLITQGIALKFSVFPILASYYDSILQLAFGLGPGHTIGRLGWLMPRYGEYLMAFGATDSHITQNIFAIQEGHWMTNSVTGSSMWSLLYSWSGVWGDLGIFGLLSYLLLWALVWFYLAKDDLSRFLLLSIFVFGGIFSWMEEPGYMLFVISIIGLRYQEISALNRLSSNIETAANHAPSVYADSDKNCKAEHYKK